MKKLLLACLLLLATPAMAQETAKYKLCAEVTVRFTMFLVSANSGITEADYKAQWYKLLLKGDADKESQTILLQLVDLAWDHHNKDMLATAMQFYSGCAGGTSI